VQRFFEQVAARRFPEALCRQKDPELISFFNINRPEDMTRAEEIARNML